MTDGLIGGRYELGELLGRGGMAEVRKGTDSRLGRTVAIKRLRTDLASDATFQARFRREAQSSAALNHPAIVAVYDTGEEITADGIHQPYIVMEYVAGRTLRDILREGRKILPERALEIGSDVLSALEYSHKAGIIHRDIKPGNVMLTPNGDVKVMDFGIARAMSDGQQTMTQTAAVVGTAQYLSPEQARGETVDSRSDVYSAGCLLYELLTGRPPFVGDSPVAVAYQHVRENPQPPSALDPSLPGAIDAIVLTSLAKRVGDRYQSAAAMRDDIERYLGGRPVTASIPAVVAPLAAPAAAAPTGVVPAVWETRPEEPSGPRTGLLIGLALLVLALIVGGVLLMPKLFHHKAAQICIDSTVNGMSPAQAQQKLSGLTTSVQPKTGTAQDKGQIIDVLDSSNNEAVGRCFDSGAAVILVKSVGPANVSVPDVRGYTQQGAQNALGGAPYNLVVKISQVFDPSAAGNVLSTDPVAGTSVAPGSTVTITVSKGPQPVVPSEVGQTKDAATSALQALGYKVKWLADPTSSLPANTVSQQDPPAGQAVDDPTKTTVTLYISSGSAGGPTDSGSPTPSGSPT
ncbi:serine/threonine protein kinase [Nocardioides baekrokdamisoli]|uniref:non-specific serine/threonine protein kinase n=1 Tax=Nocardioides baekrokdamisoli TaxID=1804624 RepID=A0A3G9IMV1_9ACTN|nr:Stk1 family PASTA domain-containing Ser/Thr kinase [Nocardioides baekrokdamisoli]BBH17355.1 serine/threonine protein kinase [Nocardioides baekrokdamisoli]